MRGSILLEALIAVFLISLVFFIISDFMVKSLKVIRFFEEKEIAARTMDTIYHRFICNIHIPKEYNGFEVKVQNEGEALRVVLTKEGRRYERVYEVLNDEVEGIGRDSLYPRDE